MSTTERYSVKVSERRGPAVTLATASTIKAAKRELMKAIRQNLHHDAATAYIWDHKTSETVASFNTEHPADLD